MARKSDEEIDSSPEQQYLPDMAPVKNRKVHEKAKRYVARRNERIAASEEEKSAHDNLLAAMQSENLEDYVYGDLEVHIDNKQKCKVKDRSSSTEENGDGE